MEAITEPEPALSWAKVQSGYDQISSRSARSFFCLRAKGASSSGSSARIKAPRSFSFAFLVGGKFRDLQESKICRSILQEADLTAAQSDARRIS